MTPRRGLQGRAALLALPLVAACAAPMPNLPGAPGLPGQGSDPTVPAAPPPPPPVASVRHVAGTETWPGGRLHLFIFQPEAARPLDTRIEAARTAIAADPDCRWIGADAATLAAETAKQGAAYADTLLVAPLDCS